MLEDNQDVNDDVINDLENLIQHMGNIKITPAERVASHETSSKLFIGHKKTRPIGKGKGQIPSNV